MLRLTRSVAPASSFLCRALASAPPAAPAIDKSRFVLSYDEKSFPRGFLCSSTHAGVKKKAGALDLGLVVSDAGAGQTSAAACFTRNAFKAAPVNVSRDVLLNEGGRARALIVNSGCANAVTGSQGMRDALAMVGSVDSLLSNNAEAPTKKTLVVSTGVIGQCLPISPILSAIPGLHSSLASTPDAWLGLAEAFMTTDTFPKLRTRSFQLKGQEVRLAGIDKGAGMIHPSMGPPHPVAALHGTLLGVIATDAAISPPALQAALTYAVERSFNSITVDGDMSTNDTIVAFANGASGMEAEIDEHDPEFAVFRDELTSFAEELAQLVVRDGEGATKFVTVTVKVRVREALQYLPTLLTLSYLLSHRALPTTTRPRRSPRLSRHRHSSRQRCTARTLTGAGSSAPCKLNA